MSPHATYTASAEALFRYQVVSQVHSRVARGERQADAVAEVARCAHVTLDGGTRRVGGRTVYRWLRAFADGGIEGLEPYRRQPLAGSAVLEADVVRFFEKEKRADPRASVPELIRRARERGLVDPDVALDRVTVWRILRRLGVETRRRKSVRDRDARRFAYAHRMQLTLCDGKHFRAGALRARRVALFFLDDASRYGLDVVVGAGTGEPAALFLRGLYQVARRHGFMDGLYLDHGSAFKALDTAEAARKLGAHLCLGTEGYPSARGKIERFNRTALEAVLRSLDGRPDVDPDSGALELRLRHWLRELYNHTAHEALGKDTTPHQRWHADTRPLRFPEDDADLRSRFVVFVERTVSNDHVVSLDGVAYEVPRGLARQRVTLHRRVLDGTVALVHDGRLVDLHPVDVHANAVDRRGGAGDDAPAEAPPPPSAADLAFQRDFGPVVTPDGGFTDKET